MAGFSSAADAAVWRASKSTRIGVFHSKRDKSMDLFKKFTESQKGNEATDCVLNPDALRLEPETPR
jgi:hypothetical protein